MKKSEAAIIRQLTQATTIKHPGLIGIGDDAAYINDLLISKDLLVEDTHFRLHYFAPEQLAHKALHVNLSDIAAMGGTPQYVLLGLAIPEKISTDWLQNFLHAFTQLCTQHHVLLIGGDTTASDTQLFISITVLGHPHHDIKLRSCAQAGDIICVTGPLGDAYAGLIALEQTLPNHDRLKNKLRLPHARIEQGLFFSEQKSVTAMMDISDGLMLDLAKLCAASHVGANIQATQIPISSELEFFAAGIKEKNEQSAYEIALNGGDDYELLLCVRPDDLLIIQQAYEKKFTMPLYAIGIITPEQSIQYFWSDRIWTPQITPFEH